MHLYSVKAIRETRWMVECARRYILSGRSLAEMCDHNAGVARELGRHQVAIVCLSFIFCWYFRNIMNMTKYLLIFHFQVSLVWSIIKTLYWSSRGGPGDPSPSSAPLRDDTPVSGEMTAPGTGVGAVACEPDQRSARSGVGVLGVPPSTNGDVAGVGGGTGDGGGDTFTTEEEIEMDDNAEILPNGVHYGLTSYTSKSAADF